MSKYANLLFTTGTPQSSPLSPSSFAAPQVANNAGGFVFSLDKFKRLERFLILGSDGNTFYQKAHEITKENASVVTECWTEDAPGTAAIIRVISETGRAPRNSPAIFALVLGTIHPDVKVRREAFAIVSSICRTSTHLFEFVSTCKALGKGFGRGMKTAVADWYNNKTDDQLAYQLIKYRQREGYTHERLIRLSHPKQEVTSDERRAMYEWLRGRLDTKGAEVYDNLPLKIRAHIQAMATEENEVNERILPLITSNNLPWEALPTWANTKPEVWRAMLPKMPLTAMIRNLGNMTRLGVFDAFNEGVVENRLNSNVQLEKARIHPFNILNALHTYQSGTGFRGQNTWEPLSLISQALENAFYKSFQFIEPSNKRIMLALDVSGSMNSSMLFNSNLSAREASAAMAMATLRTEENVIVTGFTSLSAHNTVMGAISPLDIKPSDHLEEIVRYTHKLPFNRTDCALPMLYAMENGLKLDAFVVYTDNETWDGRIHPVEALRKYREMSGIDAKLVVVGMTSTGFSIADPNDAGMLDVVGFDSNAPAVIASFLSDGEGEKENNNEAKDEDIQ